MREDVKKYYGTILTTTTDLKTNACCTAGDVPPHVSRALANIHPEVLGRYYGCGLVAPELLAGTRILDLGCGAGRDCYVLAQWVGESGRVLGLDMTSEQLAVAERHIEYHREKFGYAEPNTTFRQGYIEQLDELADTQAPFDIIVSNCVINLSTDKEAVLRGAYQLLKNGGELYFSDVYAQRRVPQQLLEDPVLYGECLSGALYWNDFLNLARKVGFADPRLVSDHPIKIQNPEVKQKLGSLEFYSAIYRLFKIPELEPSREDYGQAVIYKGTVLHHEEQFELDKYHKFAKGKVAPVCGNSWRMLHQSRFCDHFDFIGSFDRHYGIFADSGETIPFDDSDNNREADVGGCC